MTAVSSESPRASADLSAPSANPSTPRVTGAVRPSTPSGQASGGDPAEHAATPAGADFGANEWLVDELYQRYLADPGSVDRAWWSFFADYRPARGNGTGAHPVLQEGGPVDARTAPPARQSAAPTAPPVPETTPAGPGTTQAAPGATQAPATP